MLCSSGRVYWLTRSMRMYADWVVYELQAFRCLRKQRDKFLCMAKESWPYTGIRLHCVMHGGGIESSYYYKFYCDNLSYMWLIHFYARISLMFCKFKDLFVEKLTHIVDVITWCYGVKIREEMKNKNLIYVCALWLWMLC